MRGTFGAGVDHLIEQVGEGLLVGSVEVDQVYAHYQEANAQLNHPRGGVAHALETSLYEQNRKHMEHLAAKAITREGSGIEDAMADNVEGLSERYYDRAPWEWGDLRASGHPKVESNGQVVYNRPPHVHRLTTEELRIKGDLRRLFGAGFA